MPHFKSEDTRSDILEKIRSIDQKIVNLNSRKKILVSKISNTEQQNDSSLITPEFSPDDKIRIFRNLFRGREDLFARFWVSKKTQKSGYSPVCKNEWASKICQKPVLRCAECPNREFIPLDDMVVRKHLQGFHFIGIYPMVKDETCYFLAADFDGKEWVDNVSAFRDTCNNESVPIAIERSRSGNGAHVWIFFKENIPAVLARKLGSLLITRTMSKRYQLDMKSYDRLFPNQDTLPKGGFGNLIALPLQKEAVRRGNTVFIDENYNPYADQWKFLSKIIRMSIADVKRITNISVNKNQLTNIRMSPVKEDDSPWMRLPSGKRRYKSVITDLPKEVEIVTANKLYIKTDSLPSILLNQIKRLAAFQNPEFYKKQSMRLSTYLTPRIISCSDIIDGYLAIPRGCFDDISCLLNEYNIDIKLRDKRETGNRLKLKFYGKLNKEQLSASKRILKHDIGVLSAQPGSGKTIIAIHAIVKRKTNTLILVHRKPLMDQWCLQLASFLGVELKDIGQIGANKNKANGSLGVAMIQSMERKGTVDDRIADYGFIIVDECHHVSAVSFERVLMQAKAKYMLGLTATPYRNDGHQPIIHMQCGPIRYQKRQKDIKQKAHRTIVIPKMTGFSCEWSEGSRIHELWPKLIDDKKRNQLIASNIFKCIENGRFPIIITERREHLESLLEILGKEIDHLIVLHGGLNTGNRKEALDRLSGCSSGKKRAILATGAYIGEGFDNPYLDTLFITMPISFKGKVVQYVGRLHRHCEGKSNVYIYDYVDENVSVLSRMYAKRLKTYKMMGYEVSDGKYINENLFN